MVNLFFLGQYVLLSLMAPSFAAGTITGEKERRTYEMLLASPLRPGAIVVGKLLASLSHLAVLVFASLPIVMLCLPLGGVSLYEVLATYLAMAASVVTFGMICVAASSRFTRTIAALVVSYLIILPMVLVGVLFYRLFEEAAEFRLVVLTFVIPAGCAGGLRGPVRRRRRGGCCIRPTSAPRPRKSSIPTSSSGRPWAWSSAATSFPTNSSPRPSGPTSWTTG